jgi:alkaline phosphatase
MRTSRWSGFLVVTIAACASSTPSDPDATIDPDAATAPDAAAAPDATIAADAGTLPDAVAAPDAGTVPDAAAPGPAPAVIVLIGDGMGPGQLAAASIFRHGEAGRLYLESLPVRGALRTGGPSGITDSAAAATAMATGVHTYNGVVGLDRDGAPLENLVERAHARGWSAGIVTTAALPHATPAAFTAHADSRAALVAIADQQIRTTRPEVMLGGGARYVRDGELETALAAGGYTVVATADALATATAPRLFGAFADEHMTYVRDRAPTTAEPTLPAMAAAALTALDRDPDGFFLLIEGGRIDHASHDNDLARTIDETLAFDDTVRAVHAWAAARGNTTLLVTADHETGGLEVTGPASAGTLPPVRWRWGLHTNARVGVYGDGPGADAFAGEVRDARWIHAVARARIDGTALVPPPRVLVPDGELGDLRHRGALQEAATGFGAGFNQLDALWVDADSRGLAVGVEGIFQWGDNAVEIWIDVDPGASTGAASPAAAVSDGSGAVDRVLAACPLTAPALAGFGADLALVSAGGADPHREDLGDDGGLRGLRPPYGRGDDLGWLPAAINFGAVRTRTTALPAAAGQGLEAFIEWPVLYPAGIPAGARVALAAVLVNGDGGFVSNQALPPFPEGTANPGRAATALPGVVVFTLDGNGDGVIDADQPPTIAP